MAYAIERYVRVLMYCRHVLDRGSFIGTPESSLAGRKAWFSCWRDELVPSVAAVFDELVVGAEDAVRASVVAYKLPNCALLEWGSCNGRAVLSRMSEVSDIAHAVDSATAEWLKGVMSCRFRDNGDARHFLQPVRHSRLGGNPSTPSVLYCAVSQYGCSSSRG